jgi:hypothetical protein
MQISHGPHQLPAFIAMFAPCRGKVMEWLAALGAVAPADEHDVLLPELAPHHWQQLHSADPMWTRPDLDRCGAAGGAVADSSAGVKVST